MKYAIELYYDKETEQKLFNLAKRVADEKLSTKFLEWKTRPHEEEFTKTSKKDKVETVEICKDLGNNFVLIKLF